MKIPLRWLRDYVGLSLGYPQLVERLTLAGLEVASVRVYGHAVPESLRVKPEDVGPVWDADKIIIAQVRNVERHPNADRLLLVTLDYGKGVPKTVVTGAPNLKPGDHGQKVVLALCGSVLFDGHSAEKKLVELKPKDLRGIPNDAMVCSAYELGISDEHEGIIILSGDAPVGRPLVDFIGDIVLELDVLPNMARCQSVIGVAREVAALTGQRLNRRLIDVNVQAMGEPIAEQVKVVIEDPKLSRRYLAALIRNVRIGPSPSWMQYRLTYAGMRPISNIVDITNYILLEWGQPLHAFDYDVLKRRADGKAPTITVRPARAGEKLTTLEKKPGGGDENIVRELTPEHLVIADSVGPIALAGIKGGVETGVTEQTTNILLEAASFDPVSIRRTMRHFDLPSEASVRFSKGIHPDVVKPAADQACELMRTLANGKVCQGVVDCYPAPLPVQPIILEMQELNKLLGMNLPEREVVQTLQALEFAVERDAPDTLAVRVPPHRLDVTGSADLVEEVARIHGYDKLPATLLADRLPRQQTNLPLVLEEQTRDILVNCGLQEVINYSLTQDEARKADDANKTPEPEGESRLGLPKASYVRLKNPISPERSVMRRTLLNGVLEVVAANLKHRSAVRVFEVGAVYLPKDGDKLPTEPRHVAIVVTGQRWPEFRGVDGVEPPKDCVDFYDLKGIVEELVGDLHVPDVSCRHATAPWLHPARAAELVIKGQLAGAFGELHPKVAEAYGLGERLALAAELDLEVILAAVPERYKYRPISTQPAALRDIAIVVPEATPAEQVAAEIRQAGGDLLASVRLFDLYRGPNIPAGTKSLAYALSYQAADRTLDTKEIDKAHRKIEDQLKKALQAQIRGK